MIWVNLAKNFIGHLASKNFELAAKMTKEFSVENLKEYDFFNVRIEKTAYNNKDIFIKFIAFDKGYVAVFEFDKTIGKILKFNIYS